MAVLALLAARSQANPVVVVQNNNYLRAWAGDASGPKQIFDSNVIPFSETANASFADSFWQSSSTAAISMSVTGEPLHIIGSSSGAISVTGPTFADTLSSFNLVIRLDQAYYFQWSGSATASGAFAYSSISFLGGHFGDTSYVYDAHSPSGGSSGGSASGILLGNTNGLENGYYQIFGSSQLKDHTGSTGFTFDLRLSPTPFVDANVPDLTSTYGLLVASFLGLCALRRRFI